MVSPAALVILVLVAGVPQDDPRVVVTRVTAAVEADSATSVRGSWENRLSSDPEDSAGRLALATLDRLTFDYPAAERRYRSLFSGGPPGGPRYAAYARLGWAAALYTQGRLATIDELSVQARADARAAGDRAAEGDALYQLARVAVLTLGIETGMALLDTALSADLVLLSACRSASGVVVDGEGIQGLTAPLLQAGARAVVATGWRIDDRRTVPFVDALYDGLARGLSAGAALQEAKLRMLRQGRPPREWAAFSLYGDPSVRLSLRRPAPGVPYGMIAAVVAAGLLGVGLLMMRRGGEQKAGPVEGHEAG